MLLLAVACGGACGHPGAPSESEELETSSLAEEIAGPAPDYVVVELSSPPPAAVNRATFPVTIVVQNIGDADATAFSQTRFLLSEDTEFGNDRLFLTREVLPPLAAGAAEMRTAILWMAPGWPSGTYYILACADRPNRVAESDNHNNCLASAGTVVLTGPDLVVDAVGEPPARLEVGAMVSFSDTVRNRGTAPAGAFQVGFWLSPTPVRGPDSVPVKRKRDCGQLAVGELCSGALTARVPAVPAGSYYVLACADQSARVAESNEKNNCTASTGTTGIGPPDLVVAAVADPPAEALLGDSLSVVDTTVNVGHLPAPSSTTRLFLSLDEVLDAADLPVGSHPVPALPVDGASSAPAEAAIGFATPPGDYHLLACADAASAVFELSEANNCRASAGRVAVRPLDTTCGPDTEDIVVERVTTADGFTEIRQGAAARLIIAGRGLAAATAVRLGDIDATLVSMADDELRADISIEHGTVPGGRALMVIGSPLVACSLERAIELTPFVVSPAGHPDGHGTFQSPLHLCAPAVEGAGTGDQVLLLAGDHACNDVLLGGVTVVGEGAAATTVRGTFHLSGTSGHAAGLRDLKLVSPSAGWSAEILLDGEGARASIRGVTAEGGGISIASQGGTTGQAVIERYAYRGAGTGIRVLGGAVEVSGSELAGCAAGILLDHEEGMQKPNLTIRDSSIISCTTGVRNESGNFWADTLTVSDCDEGLFQSGPTSLTFGPFSQLTNSTLRDNTTGARVDGGGFFTENLDILDDEVTPRESERGLHVALGHVELRGGVIAGQTQAGAELDFDEFPGETQFALLFLRSLLIEGGERGVHAHGARVGCGLVLESAVVRDQTVAAVSYGEPGCGASLFETSLSVLSGHALEDLRTDLGFPFPATVDALSVTLNGNSYAGQLVHGPLSMPPDFRIVGPGDIQF